MFKLDMVAIRNTANSSRLMANPANVANLSGIDPVFISPLAALATLAISHRPNPLLMVATNSAVQAPELSDNPVDWRELDVAYQAHHFNCQICIAAGRGVQYGLRCGTGATLWALYSDATLQSISVARNKRTTP